MARIKNTNKIEIKENPVAGDYFPASDSENGGQTVNIKIGSLDNVGGADGESAYEVAVNNGFIGTEVEWLTSLEGANGTNGVDGDSAYQIAVNNGFVGTESEWLTSLEGANGINGADGTNGTDGVDGEMLEVELITLNPSLLSFNKKEKTFDYIQTAPAVINVSDTSFGAGSMIYGTWLSNGDTITKPTGMVDYSGLFSGDNYSPNNGDSLDIYFVTLLRNGVIETRVNLINFGSPALTINGFSNSGLNNYVDINLSGGGYGANDGSTPIALGDFSITNFIASGATSMSILSITNISNGILVGGEDIIRVNLSITGTPNGLESFEIQPTDPSSVYNSLGIPMSNTQTTGIINLVDNSSIVTLNNYGLSHDNSYIDISFSRGVWGDNSQLTPVQVSDLLITNTVYSSLTEITPLSISKTTGGILTGGETTIRLNLGLTGNPDGSERFEVQPVDSTSIYDNSANALVSTETTGTVYVTKQGIKMPLTFQIGVNTANINESPIGVFNGESPAVWDNRALADEVMAANSNGYLEYDLLDISDSGDLAIVGFNATQDFTAEAGVEAGIFRAFLSFGGNIFSKKNGSNVDLNVAPFQNSKLRVRRSGSEFIAEYTKGGSEYYFGGVIAYNSTDLMYVNMFIVDDATSCSNPVILL